MTSAPSQDYEDRTRAAMEMIGRTGAAEFSIRYCEEEQPVVWIAAGRWDKGWQAAGALEPLEAMYRLLNEVIDGGKCTHCERPTGFDPGTDAMPLDQMFCWYQYDPSTKTFARGCVK